MNVKRLAAGLACAGLTAAWQPPYPTPLSSLPPLSQALSPCPFTWPAALASHPGNLMTQSPSCLGFPLATPSPGHVSPCSLSFYSLRCMVLSSLINHPARAKSWVTASLSDILMNGQHFPGMNWMQTQLLMCSLSPRQKDQTGNWTPPVAPSTSSC